MDTRPIGVFDSGVGGLTVVRELRRQLPGEDIVYFGDTARVPYGTKSAKVVTGFALEDTLFLLKQDVKMVVAACNTVSAVAFDVLKQQFDLPLVGVIKPGAQAAVEKTSGKKVGVIGTPRTISSGIYEQEITALDGSIAVQSTSCPLFVPIAEEGWENRPAASMIAEEYLAGLIQGGVDTLVLGCTHYPLLQRTISNVMGAGVTLVDSAEVTAGAVKAVLESRGLLKAGAGAGHLKFFISDVPYRFREIGERFLGTALEDLTRVDLEAIDLGGYE